MESYGIGCKVVTKKSDHMVQDVYSVHQSVCNGGRLGIQPQMKKASLSSILG